MRPFILLHTVPTFLPLPSPNLCYAFNAHSEPHMHQLRDTKQGQVYGYPPKFPSSSSCQFYLYIIDNVL